MKILLVEDEKRMAEALSELFRREGYSVDLFYEGDGGYKALLTGEYGVAVLDVMLPNKDGFSIISDARNEGVSTPTLLLTAKSEMEDKIMGLDFGADDYLTKPFAVEELLARVRALSRRRGGSMAGNNHSKLSYGDLTLDAKKATLICKTSGLYVRLPEKELRIMETFLANPEQILSREQISVKVWGYENEAEYNNVEVYLSFTRKKLIFLESMTEIKAVRGLGYELRTKKSK